MRTENICKNFQKATLECTSAHGFHPLSKHFFWGSMLPDPPGKVGLVCPPAPRSTLHPVEWSGSAPACMLQGRATELSSGPAFTLLPAVINVKTTMLFSIQRNKQVHCNTENDTNNTLQRSWNLRFKIAILTLQLFKYLLIASRCKFGSYWQRNHNFITWSSQDQHSDFMIPCPQMQPMASAVKCWWGDFSEHQSLQGTQCIQERQQRAI